MLTGDLLDEDLVGEIAPSGAVGDFDFFPAAPWGFRIAAGESVDDVDVEAAALEDDRVEDRETVHVSASADYRGNALSARMDDAFVIEASPLSGFFYFQRFGVQSGVSETVPLYLFLNRPVPSDFKVLVQPAESTYRPWFSPQEFELAVATGQAFASTTVTVDAPEDSRLSAVSFESRVEVDDADGLNLDIRQLRPPPL